jgi:hypothetical protein
MQNTLTIISVLLLFGGTIYAIIRSYQKELERLNNEQKGD